MKKSVLGALVLMVGITWGYAQETNSLMAQSTAASTLDFTVAAEQGDPQAQCTLGLRYLYGKGEPQDYQQAMKWLQSSASQGNGEASYCVGYLYASGKGVTEDNPLALQWFKKALAQGYAKAQAAIDSLNRKMG